MQGKVRKGESPQLDDNLTQNHHQAGSLLGGNPGPTLSRINTLGTRQLIIVPNRVNGFWSLDFVSDAFTDGPSFASVPLSRITRANA